MMCRICKKRDVEALLEAGKSLPWATNGIRVKSLVDFGYIDL